MVPFSPIEIVLNRRYKRVHINGSTFRTTSQEIHACVFIFFTNLNISTYSAFTSYSQTHPPVPVTRTLLAARGHTRAAKKKYINNNNSKKAKTNIYSSLIHYFLPRRVTGWQRVSQAVALATPKTSPQWPWQPVMHIRLRSVDFYLDSWQGGRRLCVGISLLMDLYV